MAELNGCNRDHLAYHASNIYYLALQKMASWPLVEVLQFAVNAMEYNKAEKGDR